MNVWKLQLWETVLAQTPDRRKGLRFRYDKDVSSEVRDACMQFAIWLRSKYSFPLRIPVYVKSAKRLLTLDGDVAVGTFFEPVDYTIEPYIRIAAGDYMELKNDIGRDNALGAILYTIAHELTHYFQWINGINHSDKELELVAKTLATEILSEYAKTREHP